MQSKVKHFYSFWQLGTRVHFKSRGRYYSIVDTCITFVPEPLTAEGTSGTNETPELPDWVTVPGNVAATRNQEDDDFVPPSMSYWIENDKIDKQEVDVKSVGNSLSESDVEKISKLLKSQFKSPNMVVKALNDCDVDLSQSLIEQILKRFSYEWIPAFGFFRWSASQNGIAHSPELYNLMVDNLGKMKKFDLMWELVEEMKSLGPYVTLDTMSKVIRRLAKAGKYEDAVEAFRKMELFGVERDLMSMNLLMDALVKEGSVEYAEALFSEFRELIPPNLQTYNVLIHGWCKSGQIAKAKNTMNEMKAFGFAPDLITYTYFIQTYCIEKDFRNVDATLEQMRKDGLSPSIVTYTIIIKALAKAKETSKAFEIYEKMKRNNCFPDAAFYGVFMNALSTTGRLKDSEAVFEDMSRQGVVPDLFSYNIVITIAAKHLQEEKALKLLQKMEENHCKPDLTTYAPLLKMCCKLKRMKVLAFLLRHMFRNDVSVDLGTYTLLVSQLCRNGKLDHACSFFEELVIKGFVPMDCTYKKLVEKLEKEGMLGEKHRIEKLMLSTRQQIQSSVTLNKLCH
ncbi:pentatricopeptide repeat-containing protein mitochondrial [Dorcoceras hygrometricum]|uniref:Pentatricopeptide repeat-containing protein mitochondrial n=1 Tax=Dorcoceras hygrometricum TaxID=472368 RepID=A0A2Z7BBI3_9LAMI|nr:pentatricopeptide repeat-containing protein mitochondrial [Dorcoceras hygrometricum]